MKIGIIGSGGREHAICTFLKSSSKVDKIYCFPGNAGTSFIAEKPQRQAFIDAYDMVVLKDMSPSQAIKKVAKKEQDVLDEFFEN